MKQHLLRTVFFSMAVLIGCVLATAQTATTGQLTGTITDSSGAVIAGATVRLRNLATDQVQSLTAGGTGEYSFSLLPPGMYSIEVHRAGFKAVQQSNIKILVTETTTLPIQLEVGEVTQTVTVNAVAAQQLQTQSTALGQVVEGSSIQSLPMVTRNFTQILGFSAGAIMPVENAADLGRGTTSSAGGNVGVKTTNGSRSYDNDFVFNGVQVNDTYGAGNQRGTDFGGGIPIPNPDTLQEFKVQTAQYDASYGLNAGSQVEILTKSGSNNVHGSLWEFFRNEDMNANDYFRNELGLDRPLLRQNQYGGTIGGKFIQDKLFYFGSYQGTRQVNGYASGCLSTITSEPLLTNDRSAASLGAIYGGQTGLYGGTAVAADGSNIASTALAILNFKLPNGQYLLPTPQKVVNGKGESSFSEPCTYHENQYMLNLDYTQSSKNVISARYFMLDSTQVTAFTGGSNIPGFGQPAFNKFRNGSVSDTYAFSSRLTNQFIFGINSTFTRQTLEQPLSWATLGYPSVTGNPSMFSLVINGSYNGSANIVNNLWQFNYNFADLVSYTRGKHTLRLGGGLTREHLNLLGGWTNNALTFQSVPDLLLGLPGGTGAGDNGTSFSNIFSQSVGASLYGRKLRDWVNNLFVQDDWKLSTNLTLNLGFRWERFTAPTDVLGRLSSMDITKLNPNPPSTGTLVGFDVAHNFPGTPPTGVTVLPGDSNMYGQENTFAPRVGLAFKETKFAVLHAGYGIFYSELPLIFVFNATNTPPWSYNYSPSGSANVNDSWANPFYGFDYPLSVLPEFTPYSPTTSIAFRAVPIDNKVAATHIYSLNEQFQIPGGVLLEVGYVGTHGTHLMQDMLINQAGFATAANPIRGQTTNTLANIPERVPYEGFTANTSQIYNDNGSSHYNALQSTVTYQVRHGLQFQAAYTFSKDLETDGMNGGLVSGVTPTGDWSNPRRDYGPAFYSRPHRIVANYTYQFPSVHSGGSIVQNILNGWQTAGILTIQSGQPLTIIGTNSHNYAGITSDFGEISSNCSFNIETPGSVQKKLINYFKKSCIAAYPTVDPSGTTGFGNAPIGNMLGPDQNNWDMSLIKSTKIPFPTENAVIDFRIEAFNLFNHPQFANPATTATAGSFGQITAMSVNPRVLQLALKYTF
jgi:hypothetical protein